MMEDTNNRTTVYLCIGTQKTGTTALQSFMRENDKVVEKYGFCYPFLKIGLPSKFDNRNAQFLVFRSLLEEDGERKEEERTVRERAWKALEEVAGEWKNIILSDELIWHREKKLPDFWPKLLENFDKIRCDVKVVVYLRRQDLLVQSLWNQCVKGLPRIDMTFEECIEANYFKYYPLDYYDQLSKIAGYVGKENMIVRVYEKGQFGGNAKNLFSDFLSCFGLDLTDEYTMSSVRNNPGLNENLIEMKRIMNAIPEYRDSNDFNRLPMMYASDFLNGREQHVKYSMFSPEEQQAFMAQFEESNARVAEEFLGREDGVLFRDLKQTEPKWQMQQENLWKDLLVYTTEAFVRQENEIRELRRRINELEKGTKSEIKNLKADVRAIEKSAIFRAYRKVRHGLKGN